MKRTIRTAVTAVVALAAGSAFAAGDIPVTSSGDSVTMDVDVVVTAACSRLATNDLDFGELPANTEEVSGSVDITVECNSGIGYTVELDYGITPASAGSTQRQVTDAVGNALLYDIYQPGTTTPWGLTSDSQQVSGTGNGAAQVLTAPAKLYLEATAPSGRYSDAVQVSLCFGGPCP